MQYVHTHTATHVRVTYGQCTYVRMSTYIWMTYVHIRQLVFVYVHIRPVRFTDGNASMRPSFSPMNLDGTYHNQWKASSVSMRDMQYLLCSDVPCLILGIRPAHLFSVGPVGPVRSARPGLVGLVWLGLVGPVRSEVEARRRRFPSRRLREARARGGGPRLRAPPPTLTTNGPL